MEIRDHEVTYGRLQPAMYGLYEIVSAPNGRVAILLDPLDPTRPAEITVTVWHKTGTSWRQVDLAIQATAGNERGWQTHPITGAIEFYTTLTAPVNKALPATIELNTVQIGDLVSISLEQTGPLPDNPRRLLLEAYLPNSRLYNRLIGELKLGVYRFPSEELYGSYFILGSSRLNFALLPGVADNYRWTNLTPEATRIAVNRELEDTGVTLRATPATLSAELYNANPPRAIGLIRGTPIRLYDTITRLPLFTGILDVPPTEVTEANGDYRVTINAIDVVGVLAQITRYQATTITTVQGALNELLNKTGLPWELKTRPGEVLAPLNGVMREASLTEYMDMIAASANGTWYVSKAGTVTLQAGPGAPNPYYLIDEPSGDIAALHYVRAAVEYDPATAVSDLEITRYSTALNDEGELEAVETLITVANEQTRVEYGNNTVSVDMAVASDSLARNIGATMLAAHEPRPTLTSVSFAPYDERDGAKHGAELDALISLELCDQVHATYRNQDLGMLRVIGISHIVTPLSWRSTLKLRNERG